MDFLKLQNGPDIRGVAVDGVPGEEVNLTSEVIGKIGWAFISWLSRKIEKPGNRLHIAIGRDPRISGPDIRNTLVAAMASVGTTITDVGLSSTPAMFMSTILTPYQMDGAIMITASHLPWNRNGLKFFYKSGGLNETDIHNILVLASEKEELILNQSHQVKTANLMADYGQYLRRIIQLELDETGLQERLLKGFKIIVDAGNGSGGFFAREVLEPLGADTTGSLFLDPDGQFPNHLPNPEDGNAMRALQEAVVLHKADLGIIFDTDVDRAAFVDAQGHPIYRNHLIAMTASIVLENWPGSWIVTDSITSDGLSDFIKNKRGGQHHRYMRGYRNVINEGIRLNRVGHECHLAIETSGHAAFKENHWLDDGAYLAIRILAKMAYMRNEGAGDISNLIRDLKNPIECEEFRIKIKDPSFKEPGQKIISDLENFVVNIAGWNRVQDDYEGIRIQCVSESGWFLLRLSLHDPVLVLNLESDQHGGIALIIEKLLQFFNPLQENLDIGSLVLHLKQNQ